MQTLYKYYSNSIPSDYFEHPTIKLTSSGMLNDPFEKIVPIDLINTTIELYKDFNPTAEMFNLAETFNEMQYEQYIKVCGIVSLSETPRNTLMWSHYTNQHKGICIGYNSDMLVHKEKSHDILPCFYSPIKINYDNRRYDKHTDIIDGSSLNEIRKNIITKALTTKGNDWIYEKEYRLIIPMEHSDAIIHTGDNNLLDVYKNEIILANKKSFKLKDESSFFTNVLCDRDDLIFIKNINKSDITSVYLGCQIEPKYKHDIIEEIVSSSELKHVRIFQIEPHKNEFEFIPKLIRG